MVSRFFKTLLVILLVFIFSPGLAGLCGLFGILYVLGLIEPGPDINESLRRQGWLYYHDTPDGRLKFPNGFGNGTDTSLPPAGYERKNDAG